MKNKKEYKVISHCERINNSELHNFDSFQKCEPSYVLIDSKKLVDGRLVGVSEKVLKDPREFVKKYKVTDFCIDNLQAVNAVGNLKIVTLDGGVMNSIDNAVSVLDSLDSIKDLDYNDFN